MHFTHVRMQTHTLSLFPSLTLHYSFFLRLFLLFCHFFLSPSLPLSSSLNHSYRLFTYTSSVLHALIYQRTHSLSIIIKPYMLLQQSYLYVTPPQHFFFMSDDNYLSLLLYFHNKKQNEFQSHYKVSRF